MKLTELINKIDIDKVIQNKPSDFNPGIFSVLEELGLDYNYDPKKADVQDRIFSEYISVRYSTDSWVGLKVYVFDREVVAFSNQTGRKCDEKFYWVSRELYEKVKEFCLSLTRHVEDFINLVENQEIDENGYTLHFSGEMIPGIHKTAKLNGEVVNVLKDADPKNIISRLVVVQGFGDMVSEVRIDHLLFPYQFLKDQDNES